MLRTPTVHTQLVISVETARLCVLYALSLEMTPFDRSYVILQRDGQRDSQGIPITWLKAELTRGKSIFVKCLTDHSHNRNSSSCLCIRFAIRRSLSV